MRTAFKLIPMFAVGAVLTGCAHVRVDPIEVKTIHIVHDVNIRVDKELDDFFAFQEQKAAAASRPSSTAPATQTAHTAGDVR